MKAKFRPKGGRDRRAEPAGRADRLGRGNKKVFDLLPLLIIERLNKLIESLQAANSAGQIGADAFTK